ncbi:hypothetical protein L2E82_30664 [Cichorium intybus]|uniref:Uncharacterized protein n=1 Tax=Cichorium intybus TaxID=13427 RepID=A0ACB9D0Z6_CICIN|nr:hypothetical protein L2E82_30664 [Cichorium intybus]
MKGGPEVAGGTWTSSRRRNVDRRSRRAPLSVGLKVASPDIESYQEDESCIVFSFFLCYVGKGTCGGDTKEKVLHRWRTKSVNGGSSSGC